MPHLSQAALDAMRCPICHADLRHGDDTLRCSGCAFTFPIVDGVPIVLNEEKSVFTISDYTTPSAPEAPPSLLRRLRASTPSIGHNIKGRVNYARYAELIRSDAAKPRVLVLGGRILGQGMEPMAENPDIDLVETDVCTGPRTQLICDAHDVPFQDHSFDGIIIQAVLEHVCDPYRCVEEIHRVLKPGGLLYAETPFMQQVHGRAWDFTRFTDLGHRRLFRRFEEIERGACCGPGMALAWSWQYFLLSFSSNKVLRAAARLTAEFTSFWLKYIDYLIINTRGTQDAASGFYFLGRKSATILSDRALIKLWRGDD